MAKSSKKVGRKSLAKPVEFTFKIDAYSPKTFPMQRLGEYLAEFGKLMGETAHVHFQKLTTGSTKVAVKVDYEAFPKVKQAMASVRDGSAPGNSVTVYKEINRMLRDDNATAECRVQNRKAIILSFPGRNEVRDDAISIRQKGSLAGLISRVGGADDTAHVQLLLDNKRLGNLETTRTIARELGKHLYCPVRVHGEGRWKRAEDGTWSLEQFTVRTFDVLEESDLTEAIKELRGIKIDWSENAFEQLLDMRTEKKH